MPEPAAADAAPTLDQRHGGGSNVLVSFGPWIAVWILTSSTSYLPGLAVATAVSIGLIGWTFWEGSKPKLLDWGTLIAIASLLVVGLVTHGDWLGTWLNPILNGALLAIMLVSVAIGRPFTLEYAKEQAPPEVWDSPDFKRINLIITLVWILAILAMTIGAVVSSIYASGAIAADAKTVKHIDDYANWGVTIVALIVAMKFTAWFPDAYMARKQQIADTTTA